MTASVVIFLYSSNYLIVFSHVKQRGLDDDLQNCLFFVFTCLQWLQGGVTFSQVVWMIGC